MQNLKSTFLLGSLMVLLFSYGMSETIEVQPEISIDPFTLYNSNINDSFLKVKMASQTYESLHENIKSIEIELPLPEIGKIKTTLEPFQIVSNDAQFLFGSKKASNPTIKLYRGTIANDANSVVFLTISEDNKANGMISTGDGSSYILSESVDAQADGVMTIHKESTSSILPDFPNFCGVPENATYEKSLKDQASKATSTLNPKTRIATIALDGDLKYVDLFDNETDAQNYAVQLIGAISSIYIRDFDVKLEISFLRLWSSGGEPYNAASLSDFRNYWINNENPDDYNIVHLLSGRRDLSFGGIAYLSGTCLTDNAFSISGYLNGSFPSPLDDPDLGNWDVIVGAHEMGHNFGTGHTHDDPNYVPLIDSCAQGYPTQGTIMSYCHTHPGYTTNTELRFHGRVIELVKSFISSSNCWAFDCNDNGIADSIDINSGFSADLNFNNVPDECEDCDGDGTLNFQEIIAGAPDIDINGIPDECEPDCNMNGIPDVFEISLGVTPDLNYNNIPDSCEEDCDANGIIDYIDIKDGTYSDYDRNLVPDVCQDCNNNSVFDWIDVEKPLNLFVADITGDYIREYHANSGVPIGNITTGIFSNCYDIIFDQNKNMYAADFSGGFVLKIDAVNNTNSSFINDGFATSPSALLIAPNGNLLVANSSDSKIFEYDISTGSLIGEFISGGTLSNPMGMAIGFDGNLYVSSANSNSILKYNGTTGAYISEFIATSTGGLDTPYGLVFDNDGNLLVCSYNNHKILRYNGTTGVFIDIFSDEVNMSNPWDIAVGPNGNIFVSRGGATPRIIEYDPVGRYYRSFVRGDAGMLRPTGIAFMPESDNDCNGNFIPDDCDIASGFSLDANMNFIPDECESVVDADNDGVTDDLDCDDNNPDVQFELTYYFDNDDDGFGDQASAGILFCTPPDGYVLDNTDCDDSDSTINTTAIEICDGKDNDCNGFIDDGLGGVDSDFDGIPDDCDSCPNDPDNDIDNDGFCADVDNCPLISNPLQEDANFNNIGDACCCVGMTGNVDDDPDNIVDISDLVLLVDFMFTEGGPLPCPLEANIDADIDGIVDISDLVMLVDFMFSGLESLPNCQ